MAVVFTKTKSTADVAMFKQLAGFDIVCGNLNIGDTYATGGIAVAATDFDANATTLHELVTNGSSEDDVVRYAWNVDTGKLQAFDAIGTEEGAATDLSADAKSVRVIAIVS